MFKPKNIFVLGFIFLSGCVSLSEKETKVAPTITADMPLEEAIVAGIKFGGTTLKATKSYVASKKKFAETNSIIRNKIERNYKSWSVDQLVNSLNLYQYTKPKNPDTLFELLVNSKRSTVKVIAWHLAAGFPSKKMGEKIEKVLTLAVERNSLGEVFIPQMANAVAANRLKSVYSIIRKGLIDTNEITFAQTMIHLDPHRASEDFLTYLAGSPVEELRQLTLKTLNPYTVVVALQHLQSHPAEIDHKDFNYLYFFAVSRNNVIAELAREVLENYLPKYRVALAAKLNKLPVWVQVSFIENSKHDMTAALGSFFRELKKYSVNRAVLDEINSVKF